LRGGQKVSDYEYHNWYARQNYDRIQLLVPRGSRDALKRAAQAEGKSLNAFIMDRLPTEMLTQREKIGKRGLKNHDDSGTEGRAD
jgi:hypothetical protein